MKVAQHNTRQEILRFDTNARIEIFVDSFDIKSENDFDSIMDLNIPDEEKIHKLKEIALRVANEAIDNVEGVTITSDLSISSIDIDSIDWIGMIEQYKEDKDIMNEINSTKIKLSQSQWRLIGKKAGWIPRDPSEYSDEDLGPIMTPEEEEEILLGPEEDIEPNHAYKEGYKNGLLSLKDNSLPVVNPYRIDTDSGVALFDEWRDGFRDAEKGFPSKY